MPFNAHEYVATDLPVKNEILGLAAVTAEAQASAPPLDMSHNYADMPDVEGTVSIAVAAAEITGVPLNTDTPAQVPGPAPDTFTV